MSDIDLLDATLNELCACGCGQPLDPAGPSGWWATEGCQRRGTRGLTGAQDEVTLAHVVVEHRPFSVVHNGRTTRYCYHAMSDAERVLLHDWLRLHNISPGDVPVATVIRINGSWLVTVVAYRRNEAGSLWVVTKVVQRRLRAPWPLDTDTTTGGAL